MFNPGGTKHEEARCPGGGSRGDRRAQLGAGRLRAFRPGGGALRPALRRGLGAEHRRLRAGRSGGGLPGGSLEGDSAPLERLAAHDGRPVNVLMRHTQRKERREMKTRVSHTGPLMWAITLSILVAAWGPAAAESAAQ